MFASRAADSAKTARFDIQRWGENGSCESPSEDELMSDDLLKGADSLAPIFLATKRAHCFSPFRYPGGKTWLTPFIIRWLSPKVGCIVEPFTGGGNVSIAAIH